MIKLCHGKWLIVTVRTIAVRQWETLSRSISSCGRIVSVTLTGAPRTRAPTVLALKLPSVRFRALPCFEVYEKGVSENVLKS